MEMEEEQMDEQAEEAVQSEQAEGAAAGATQNTHAESEIKDDQTASDKATAETVEHKGVLSTDAGSSDGGEDGDHETDSEAPEDDGFRQPREQRRRHRRTKKRAATSGDSASGDGLLKKTKVVGVESESESKTRAANKEPQLDPTLGRRHSFSRIPTGRRQQ